MKLKKVSRVLSLVVAGAMVLAMAPAAFAASSCFHEHMTYVSNHDGATHQAICDDCHLEEQMACTFVNGKCTKCDAPDPSCNHSKQLPVDNGNGTCSYVCDACGTVIDTAAHVYYNGETKCARCGHEKVATDTSWCDHVGKTFSFEALGDGTHNVICNNCGETVSLNVACFDDNADGRCDACSAAMPACNHSKQHPVDNGNGTCSYVCDECKTVINTTAHVYYNGETTCARCGHKCDHSKQHPVDNGNGTCSYVCDVDGTVIDTAAHVYYKGETTCARCGAKKPACDHMGNHWTYVKNGNSTHNVVCTDCGAVVSANVACNYENGVCITCGAKQSECNHMGNHWTYKDNGNGTHKVICKDCGNVVEKHADCVYTEGKCAACGHKKVVFTPDTDDLDPSFSVSRYPICQFFQAVREFFRSLFHRA